MVDWFFRPGVYFGVVYTEEFLEVTLELIWEALRELACELTRELFCE